MVNEPSLYCRDSVVVNAVVRFHVMSFFTVKLSAR